MGTLIKDVAEDLRLGEHRYLYLHSMIQSCVLWVQNHPSGTPLPVSALAAYVRKQIEEAPGRVKMLEAQIDNFVFVLRERLNHGQFERITMIPWADIIEDLSDEELAIRRCARFLTAFVLEELSVVGIPVTDGSITTPRSNGPKSSTP